MPLVVRCPNSGCGHASQLGDDSLGRVFRCPRCFAKLPSLPGLPAAIPAVPGGDQLANAISRSAAKAASLAASASAAWNHPVLISSFESSLLDDREGSGEILIGGFRPAERTGREGLDRVHSGIGRLTVHPGAFVGRAGMANPSRMLTNGEGSSGGISVAELGLDFDFDDDDDDDLSCVEVPPPSGGSGASWSHGGSGSGFGAGSRRGSAHDPDRTAGADGSSAELMRLGRFRVQAILGEGAKATVYRAYDPLLDRNVALKVPRPGAVKSRKAAFRFLAEAKALARLRHPRIVPVFEAGQIDGTVYIAIALVEGKSLAEVMSEGALDPRRSAEIVRDLAEALSCAHDQGIVHRDVKPANVRIDESGGIHLMDFGIAYLPDSGEVPVPPGVILGTPAYVAPEQAKGGQSDVLPASDQYSLGVVLYELLCGQPPFNGPPSYVLFHTIHQDPPSPRAIAPSVPKALAAICLKALSKQPENRYASCQALADDLKRWLLGETPHATRRLSWSLRTG